MYDPNDSYIKKLIDNGIRNLVEAIDESTNKQQTKEDILKKFKKEVYDEDDMYDMNFK